ncbi:hypothetical protein D554_3038 [Bordetella holmesii 30539]|uniref:N-acetyltransferase YedL n=1 Tax=Bordetella holmesii 1058 TaxID=1247648 RepID=A0ABN0RXM0_9BORD|nr:hypothetical protein D560_3129 [Bordetella holmesii ATCC 51541]EWM40521.1 hypothetical protein D555_3160 [Bordetella holmesii 35009]EWM44033.1 hypothetical protein D556_3102 [Bordetella holmesii 41130]EWM49326.1 hypothetical protein D557_2404 [Bordetella holmesii 70147]EXF87767.1 hypothetical protein D554_3038 [Bordetella holmesii 30539]EXX93765.1 hypothetical protein D559_1168 [Bordetella holmesii 1058]
MAAFARPAARITPAAPLAIACRLGAVIVSGAAPGPKWHRE